MTSPRRRRPRSRRGPLVSALAGLLLHLVLALYYCFQQAGGANLRPEPESGSRVEP